MPNEQIGGTISNELIEACSGIPSLAILTKVANEAFTSTEQTFHLHTARDLAQKLADRWRDDLAYDPTSGPMTRQGDGSWIRDESELASRAGQIVDEAIWEAAAMLPDDRTVALSTLSGSGHP